MSRDGGKESGGVWGGEEDGGRTLVEEVEEEEEDDDDEGVGPSGVEGGLEGLGPATIRGWRSGEASVQVEFPVPVLPSGLSTGAPFSRGFFPGLRRRLVAEDDVGEDADDDVEVVELGLTFLDFVLAPKRAFRGLPVLFNSLARPDRGSSSEQGLRNGDRLSLSRRNTTAIDPPTDGPAGPTGPSRSRPSLPEFPVVLLTPSRTSTDTLDCSLAFRPPTFFDLPERPELFLLGFSLLVLRPLLAEDTEASIGRELVIPKGTDREGLAAFDVSDSVCPGSLLAGRGFFFG